MKKWNQVNKRLKTIIAPELDVVFNRANLFRKTLRSEIYISHFHVKFNNKIIWESQKDSAYCNIRFYDKWEQYAEDDILGNLSPANIIAQYLDTPKEKLLQFDEPTGLKFILWACDKRIGKDRLSKTRFTKWALPIVKERVPEYNLEPIIHQPCPIIYTCDDFTVFDIDKYKFYGDFLFVVANNIDYSVATHATCLEKKRAKNGYWKIPSKKVFDLTEEQIKLIRDEVQKYQDRLFVNKNAENINKEN